MKSSYSKLFYILILYLAFVGCSKNEPSFVLNGKIHGDYSGYIYLEYDSVKDSFLVSNNKFNFRGSLPSIAAAMLSTKRRTSAMEVDFYLEPREINIEIEIQRKTIRETELDWIVMKSIEGSETALLQADFANYKKKFENSDNWQGKKYGKIEDIITHNPRSTYSAALLGGELRHPDADTSTLKRLYAKLDMAHINSTTVNFLKTNLFPKEFSFVGKQITDFELQNGTGNLISTKEYRGKLLLVDFWASWCAPCREQMPELVKIYNQYKNQDFNILAISLDSEKDRQKWLNAIEKEGANWDNVIEKGEFAGKVAKSFNIQAIPSNFLIDAQGLIIAENIDPAELETQLKKYYDN